MESTKPIRKKRRSRKPEASLVIENIVAQVKTSGSHPIKLGTLFQRFGFKKRGPSNLELMNDLLKSNKIYAYPKIDMSIRWDRLITLNSFPVEAIGDLFPNEKQLENYIYETDAYKKLDIVSVKRQCRPISSKERIDFKGIDKDGRYVVLELKNKDGGEAVISQVLKYAGYLQMEHPDNKIRIILVTGVRGVKTAMTLKGMILEQRKEIEWYLYKFNNTTGTFSFSRVTDDFILKNTRSLS